MDNPSTALRARVLLHMNAWGEAANVVFTETAGTGEVRIARLDTGRHGWILVLRRHWLWLHSQSDPVIG